MREIFFEYLAHEQFLEWEKRDKKILTKIAELLEEARREPFKGRGKPEPLKYQYKGCWSRRINEVHRLVYKVTPKTIIVVSCKFHY